VATRSEKIAQILLEYVEDLVTESPKETWNKVDLLVLFNLVKNDSQILGLLRRVDRAQERAQRPA
jgi:hypothetical protein